MHKVGNDACLYLFVVLNRLKKIFAFFSCIYNKQHSASSQNDFKKNKTQGKMIFNVTMFIPCALFLYKQNQNWKLVCSTFVDLLELVFHSCIQIEICNCSGETINI